MLKWVSPPLNFFTGEALDLDLSDFIQSLYALLLPLGVTQDIESTPPNAGRTQAKPTADLLFRALDLGLNGRVHAGGAAAGSASAARRAAFARRLLGCALGWPGASAVRAIEFVRGLVARDKRLLALLDAEEAVADGVWRPEIDDPDLANALAGAAWEIGVLRASHVDERVRTAAAVLGELVKEI
jgi:nucleolar complex protein 3